MATIKDISEKIGVSPATISRVLNNDDSFSVSEKVKQDILETAYQLGYMTPREKKQRNKHITFGVLDSKVIINEDQNDHIKSLGRIARKNYRESSIGFVRINHDPDMKVDGIIAFGGMNEQEIRDLKQANRNVVLVDCTLEDYEINQIRLNLDYSFQEAAAYLTAKGIHDLAYIGGIHEIRKDYSIGYARRETAKDLIKACGVYNEGKVLTGKFTNEDGYELCCQLLQNFPEIDGLYIGSDIMAEGVIRALGENGRNAGDNIEILIYRDIQSSPLPDKKVALIDAYPEVLWDKAVEMLVEHLTGQRETLATVITPKLKVMI